MITTIIPNYNGMRYLPACIEAMQRQTLPSALIVVDNGSTDNSLPWLRDLSQQGILTLIELGKNTGFAHAVNVGIEAADTPFVLLLNDDTEPTPEMTAYLYRRIRMSGRNFSVGAKMLSMREGHPIDDCGDLFCALGWAFSPGRDRDNSWYNKPVPVTSACAGAAIYRRDVLKEIGGFDDAHFCYLEDVDVGLRARIHGYRNLYEPQAVCYHAGSATSGSRYNLFKERLTAANTVYLLYKNLPDWQLFLNAPLLLAGFVIKAVYFARRGLGRAYAAGLVDGLRKCAAHADRRVSFTDDKLLALCGLQWEYWVNCIRRLAG